MYLEMCVCLHLSVDAPDKMRVCVFVIVCMYACVLYLPLTGSVSLCLVANVRYKIACDLQDHGIHRLTACYPTTPKSWQVTPRFHSPRCTPNGTHAKPVEGSLSTMTAGSLSTDALNKTNPQHPEPGPTIMQITTN
jgi:hypothetical protein